MRYREIGDQGADEDHGCGDRRKKAKGNGPGPVYKTYFFYLIGEELNYLVKGYALKSG